MAAAPEFAGIPGWKRGDCLGCGRVVSFARHPHVLIGGRPDGSGLVLMGLQADRSLAEEVESLLDGEERWLLGVAHRECIDSAQQRLQDGLVELPEELPLLKGEEIDEFPEEYHLPPTGKFCPFCGSDDLTVEHVWPQWVSRALRRHSGAASHDRPFVLSIGDHTRTLHEIGIEAPACTLCNNRWLSALEQDVQPILEPMILGEERILNPGEQRLLATWAAKTALLFDLFSGENAVIPMGFYREFAQLRSPLPSQRIWIGAYLGQKPVKAFRDALWIEVPVEERPNAVAITFTVFRIVFQVFGHFVKSASMSDQRYQFGSAIHRMWPINSASIRVPPRKIAFGDESLEMFATSFSGRHPSAPRPGA